MPSLKDLRNRIATVKSTQKITAAMKMVAASKLRRAQEQAEAGRPYADRMERMLTGLAAVASVAGQGPKLMAGTGKSDVHLLLVITSDRGLAGAFNATVVREARRQIRELQGRGKTVKLFTVGRKGRDSLRRDFANLIVESVTDIGRPRLGFADADGIAIRILAMFEAGDFDVCSVVYNKFKSAIAQIITVQQLVPVAIPAVAEATASNIVYEFEPSEEQILAELLPRNLAIQIYKALLESAASEQGARMTAMDNATRNAGDMIKKLTLVYNRTRQAYITKELIEIISGSEAV
ncbi:MULTISPECIES: F0F1 ATP synthase subunit gamma [Inquilinus]|jgi:F-type H+-transporting ATPase subunit gamma|uniref:ATP synthase gamma chain n=1 Tax=Inquilinus ginsengisoli TaxID=363840 RepID=A0ABU1JWA6_9PROT|nr:F0F1 ATP synthase subunit gamma [Inquilinus ginsengisoli]MDR6292289.1 F-type H+-transporting ATPase subunit gamma [Inquilinus ginsengisoli]